MKYRHSFSALFGFFAAILTGTFLRLNQFSSQVLIDDEWHALHQLIENTPSNIAMSFGHADYSIPLTLLYWVEAQWFGLSELAMRWPMMASGLITLLVFPAVIRRQFGDREAILFAALLAVSPLLIIYSRTARPYAITLLLGYVAMAAFHAYRDGRKHANVYGFLYGVTSTLCVWLHPLTIPWVVAPCILEFFTVLALPAQERKRSFGRLFALGIPTALAMMIFVLPPLLADPGALAGKAGIDLPTLDTLFGAGHLWFGTGSLPALLIGLSLSLLGWGRLWRALPLVHSTVVGLALTVGLIFMTSPEWVYHPLTFGRYLLPLLPLLLLSVALGSIRLVDALNMRDQRCRRYLTPILLLLPVLVLTIQSPVFAMLRSPNTSTLHSLYQFDFRPSHNLIRQHLNTFPLSPFWDRMRLIPANTLRVAVAPWFFESYDWLSPRWEQMGRQPIVPAYLTGFCFVQRWGEPLRDARFKFRNGVFLDDIPSTTVIDVLVFQKPFIERPGVLTNYTKDKVNPECMSKLLAKLGVPDYEDDTIVSFFLSPSARASLNAQRE